MLKKALGIAFLTVLLCSAFMKEMQTADQRFFPSALADEADFVISAEGVLTGYTGTDEVITIPDTVVRIGQQAFENCTSLVNVTIPEGVTHIGDSAFSGCTSLQEITLPQSLLAIDGWAFSGCASLVSLTLPDGVETIGNAILNGSDAVVYCRYDSSAARAISRISHDFYIPGDGRFLLRYITEGEQTKLTLISYTGDEPDVAVPSYIQELDYSVFAGNTTIETVVLPSGITKISYGVFKNCTALTSVTLPDTVTDITQSAFDGCSHLAQINIPEGVTHIGDSAFSGCTSLQEITLPQSILAIDGWAFSGCEGLVSFTLPDGVETIGNAILNGSEAVVYCHYDSSAARAISRISHDFYIPGDDRFLLRYITEGEQTRLTLISYTRDETDVVVPSYIQELDYSVFAENTTIETVVLPSGITKISYGVFKNCAALTSVTLPDTVTDIAQGAFEGCSHLAQINIPKGVTHIGNSAFYGCTSLTEILLPTSLRTIEGYAFGNCTGISGLTLPDNVSTVADSILSGTQAKIHCSIGSKAAEVISNAGKSFYLPGDDSFALRNYRKSFTDVTPAIALVRYTGQDSEVTIPDYVDVLLDEIFLNNRTVSKVTIPEGFDTIPNNMFNGCWHLQEVSIPSTVNKILNQSFKDCTALTAVVLPDGLKSMGFGVFNGCSNLRQLVLPEGLLSIGANAFVRCYALGDLTIPDSVTNIGEGALSGPGRVFCNYDSTAARLVSQQGLSFCVPGAPEFRLQYTTVNGITKLALIEWMSSENPSVTVPHYVKRLADYAFHPGILEVTLPEGIEYISRGVFSQCSTLVSLLVPQSVKTIEPEAFARCGNLRLLVYENSYAETYAADNGIPFEYVIPQSATMEIHLAAAEDIGSYAGCKLMLLGSGGQSAAVTLTGSRSAYSFSGVLQAVEYNVRLVTPYGDVLASLDEALAAAQGTVYSLEIPTALSYAELTLKTPDGEDVTQNASVSWYDGERLLSAGGRIDMQPVGKTLTAKIALNSTLGVLYAEPSEISADISAQGFVSEVTLAPLARRTVTGTVVDADTGTPAAGAVLAASQTANGRYACFSQAQADENGCFELSLIEGAADVAVRKNGYVEYRTDLTDTRIALQPLSAPGVSMEVRYLAVGENGPEESPVSPDGLVVSAVDLSTGNEVQTVMQYPSVLFPQSRAGDRLRLMVSSRNDVFAPGEADFVLEDSKDQQVSLTVVQHGGIQVLFTDDTNAETLLMLFDSDGRLVMSRRTTTPEATFRPVAVGAYTLVMMGYHPRIAAVPSLDMLDALGLAEGRDFVRENVDVPPAVITQCFAENTVPKLEAEVFSFLETGRVTRSRDSVIAGEYVTITASASLKAEYSDAENLTWLVAVPEGSRYVAGSAVIDKAPVILPEDAGNLLEIPVSDLSGKLRLCVSPVRAGDYSINVYLCFEHNGETVTQPVGAAQYQAKGLTVVAPATAGPESITIRGTASAKAKVSIYDVNQLIGQTQAKANGEWSVSVILDDANISAFHVIRVEAQDSRDESIVVTSGSSLIRYSPGTIQLRIISMVNTAHPAENLAPQEYQTVFDYGQLSRSKIYYRYWPAYPEFTFILKFTDNSPEKLSKVQVLVRLSDNSTQQLDAVYSRRQDAWFASSRYEDSGVLPVQVGVSFQAEKEVILEAAELEPETFELKDVTYETAEIANPDGKEAEIHVTNDDGTVLLTRRVSLSEVTEDKWKEMLTVKAYTKAESAGGFEVYQYSAYTDRSIVKESVFVRDGYAVICRDTVESDLLEFVHDVFSLVEMDECKAMYQELKRIKALETPKIAVSRSLGADDPFISRTAVANYDNFRQKFDHFENKWHGRDAIDLYSGITNLIDTIYKLGGTTAPYLPDVSMGYDTFKDFTLALALLEDIIDCKGISATSAVKMKLYVQIAPYLTIASRLAWQTAGSVGDTLDTIFKGLEGIWEKAVEILSDFKTHVPGYDNYVSPGIYDQSVFEDWRQGWLKDANDYIDDASRWPMLFYDVIEDTLREKCKRPKPDSEEGDPIQDPSGVVYEAVPENLLSGVKVTCIEQVTEFDQYGEPVIYEREWDAQEYGQLNPQVTDESGSYCWDVPEGLWRVRYEKKGYETAYSEWMTVPPPRFEINVGLVSYEAPEVAGIRAFTDGVEISFSKYIKTETVTNETVHLSFEGEELIGIPEWLDAAEDPANPGKMLGKKVLFRTEDTIAKGAAVTISVSANVVSYAGASMQGSFTGTAEVTSRIDGIAVDEEIALTYGETKTVTIAAFPAEAAAGREIGILPVSETVAAVSENTVTLNAEGKAAVDVTGLMAGSTLIRFTLVGTESEAAARVSVAMPEKEQAAAPEASIPADSVVPYASKITLSTETDGAEIYYMFDAEDVPERMLLYTEPIVLHGDATIFAVAAKNGMQNSETAVFSYRIADDPIVEETVCYAWADWCETRTGDWDESLETLLGRELDWASDNENVAQIKDGKITIRGAGEAAIHATDGIYEVARFDVVVNDVGPGLVLPGEMKTVGNEAFKRSNHIQAVRVSSKTYEIGEAAFEDCESLKIILIPDSVRIIGDGAFNACAKDFSIVGVAGSPAAHYAEKTGIPFFAIP